MPKSPAENPAELQMLLELRYNAVLNVIRACTWRNSSRTGDPRAENVSSPGATIFSSRPLVKSSPIQQLRKTERLSRIRQVEFMPPDNRTERTIPPILLDTVAYHPRIGD